MKMDYDRKDAARISELLGCALLFAMLMQLTFSLRINREAALTAEQLLLSKTALLAVFLLPSMWGVWKIRRSEIRLPAISQGAGLNKRLALMLSTFGSIVIIQILYESIFPSAMEPMGVASDMTATKLFLLFLFSTVVPAVAEEIFFRGFFMRCMRVFRASLAVLMSALVYALMYFSVEGFPLYFVTGLLIGMAYMATNSLITVIGISFLCKSFHFLEETVGVFMPDGYAPLVQGGLTVCVLLSAAGLPYLKENMRAFFDNDDEQAIPSAYFWTVPTILFVVLAVAIQLLIRPS
jgi:membrane protease YdiL (CAAX protease family)